MAYKWTDEREKYAKELLKNKFTHKEIMQLLKNKYGEDITDYQFKYFVKLNGLEGRKRRAYTDEQKEFIKKLYFDDKSNKYIKEKFDAKYNDDIKIGNIRSFINNMEKPKGYKRICRKYTEENKEYMRHLASKGMTCNEITEKYNEKYNDDIKISTMKSNLERYKIRLHSDGRFERGREPFNKGMKGFCYGNSKKTQFKKGHIPKNTKPVGSESIQKGYIKIKTESGQWIFKQRYIWEQHNKRKVREDEVVIFLDGDNMNFDINNLKCITKAEHSLMNSKKLRFDNPELTDAGVQVAKYINKVNQISKGRCENE